LTGKIVTEGSGAQFGDGEASGGDNQGRSSEFCTSSFYDESPGMVDFEDLFTEEDLHASVAAIGSQQADDILRGAIAEKLPQRFFVIGDAVLLDDCDEIRRSEAGQSRFGEVRIRRNEIFGAAMKVGEIAAAASRNEDFFADLASAFEDCDATAALPCLDGAEQAGCSSPEDNGIEGSFQVKILTTERVRNTKKKNA
jgi:hypothetical protein